MYEEFEKALQLQQEVGLYHCLQKRMGDIFILMRERLVQPLLWWILQYTYSTNKHFYIHIVFASFVKALFINDW